MRVVIDANRVFSAVLRDGATRRIVFSTSAQLFAPELLRREIEDHLAELVQRSGLSASQVKQLLQRIFAEITWVGEPAMAPHLAIATKAIGKRDPTDVPYLACALAIEADAIWSHDPDFDVQDLIPRKKNADLE